MKNQKLSQERIQYYFIFVILVLSNNVYAQGNWTIQCPSPAYSSQFTSQFYGIEFKDYNTGLFSSSRGIQKTTNAGLNWFQIPPVNSYGGILSYNNFGKWFLTGSANAIISTNDGISWTSLPFLITSSRVNFLNSNFGVSTFNDGIVKTTDGGYTWTSFPTGIQYFYPIEACMISEQSILVTSSYGKMALTTNGGLNWIQMNIAMPDDYIKHAKFLNENTGYVYAEYYAQLFKTTNGGFNWVQVFSTPTTNSYFDFIDVNRGIVVSGRGKIYTTTNGGSNWQYHYTDSLYNYSYVQMINRDTCVIRGYCADDYSLCLTRTFDFGNTYHSINNDSKSTHYGMHFLNSQYGFIAGNPQTGTNKILKTTNGGVNWIPVRNLVYYSKSVFSINTNITFISSAQGKISKTTDGGQSWIQQTSGVTAELNKIFFADQNTGLVCGANGTLLKTTNGGNNWYPLNTGVTDNFFSVYMFNSNTYLIAGDYGRILKTTNGGNSFEVKNINSGYWITSLSFCNANTGLAVGSSGTILKTTNAGETWISQQSGTTEQIFSVSMYSDKKAIASGMHGKILQTANGGINWIGTNLDTSLQIRCIQLLDSSSAIFCSTGGFIYSGTGLCLTSVSQINNSIPEEFLLLQNYPNPFNPVTNIQFQVASSKFIKLVVYDLLGREVKTLVNEYKQPGTYQVSFNADGLSSGVYFYQLQANNFSETKKMILLR